MPSDPGSPTIQSIGGVSLEPIDQPLRLVHITTVAASFRFLRGQVAFMQEKGFEVHAVSAPGPEMEALAVSDQAEVHSVEMERRITPIRDLIALLQLVTLLRRIRPHIVHAHTPKGGLLGMLAAWLTRTPVRVYHIRGLPFMTAGGLRRSLLKWTERVSCALSHQVLSVSHSIRRVAVEERLCGEETIEVLLGGSGNGVDALVRFNPDCVAETREELRHSHDISEDAIVLGFVGRIVRDKGVMELAGAWNRLREEFPQLVLVLVGPFEPQDAIPDETRDLLGRDSRVRSLGYVADTAPLYKMMDIVVLPTYREGFPNVLLEAGAMRLPVVATRIPGCVDAVVDGISGLLVEPRSIDELADAIRRYLQNAELRISHGVASRERILREFDQKALWEALYGVYQRLLNERLKS
jgi:glycosyltransferase involved in cell wall biosynthesis